MSDDKNIYDVAIIGGGPAGIAAGIYVARKKMKSLLLTKDFIGQVGKSFSVENYPGFPEILGPDLVSKLQNHLAKFPIEVQEGVEVKKIIKKPDGSFEIQDGQQNLYHIKAIIITSGRNPRYLNVPGELELMGKGISYCVTCDGPLFQGKTVAVIGGGNAGFESSLELARYCPKVYILELNPSVRADEVTQEQVRAIEKIEVITSAAVKQIQGVHFVEKLIYEDRASGSTKELQVQGVFVEIGSVPVSDFAQELVERNQWREIKIDHNTCATKTLGLFAAGDVTDVRDKQIGVAVGEGIKASLSAYQYLLQLKPV